MFHIKLSAQIKNKQTNKQTRQRSTLCHRDDTYPAFFLLFDPSFM